MIRGSKSSQDRDLEMDFEVRSGFGGRFQITDELRSRSGGHFWVSDLRIEVRDRISSRISALGSQNRGRESDLGAHFRVRSRISESGIGSRRSISGSDRDRELIFGCRISDSRSESDLGVGFRGRRSIFGPGFDVGGRFSVSDPMSEVADRGSSIQFRSSSRDRGPEIEGRGTSKLRFWSHFEPKMTHFEPSIGRPHVGSLALPPLYRAPYARRA